MKASDRTGRAGLVIFDGERVALIERVRAGRTYYVFPGGGVEPGETFDAAAIREAHEELGVDVELHGVVYSEVFRGVRMQFFEATVVGGEFGTGAWPDHAERSAFAREKSGTHEPVWLRCAELPELDVRPPRLAAKLARGAVARRPMTD